MQRQAKTTGAGLLGAVVLLAMLGIWLVPPIAQDPAYHRFADDRELLGIANFWNVVSSLPLSAVGVAGLWLVLGRRAGEAPGSLLPAYALCFTGVAMTGLASANYHLAATNATLLWDRLAMSVVFMALFAAIIGEYVSVRAGRLLVWPLLVLGLGSVVYWYQTDLHGAGDLRPYVLVQFLPLLLIPLILLQYRSAAIGRGWIWAMLGLYAEAKAFEMADAAVYAALGFGGHALKHLLASAGAACFGLALSGRLRAGGRRQVERGTAEEARPSAGG